jgi:hypothetical protein
MARWDVLRDEEGEAITLTPEQVRAVWHAMKVWTQVCQSEESDQAKGWATMSQGQADVAKSRLLGRMLIDGRPPLDEKPGHWLGASAYHEVEPDVDHYYMGTPIIAVRRRDGSYTPLEPIRPEARCVVGNNSFDAPPSRRLRSA